MTPSRFLPERPKVLVLGGSGFVGRHAVTSLLRQGHQVVIGSRHPAAIERKLPTEALHCPRLQVRLETLTAPEDWHPLLEGIDAVLNCVGILRQRGRETYDRIHHRAPAALAFACRDRGIPFTHVSALGLAKPARSRFLTSKRQGEQALRSSGADWRIARPSLLDGESGYGAKWIRRAACWPVHCLPANAVGRIAALDARELGEALAVLALKFLPPDADIMAREFELGGPEALPLADLLAALRRLHTRRSAPCLRIPAWLARLASHVFDLVHVTPFSFGHYELLRHDNRPRCNRMPELLGRMPRTIGLPTIAEGDAVDLPVPG